MPSASDADKGNSRVANKQMLEKVALPAWQLQVVMY